MGFFFTPEFARETDRYKNTKFIFLSPFKDVYGNIPELNSKSNYFLDNLETLPGNGCSAYVLLPSFLR